MEPVLLLLTIGGVVHSFVIEQQLDLEFMLDKYSEYNPRYELLGY